MTGNSRAEAGALFVGRVLMAALFVIEGYGKAVGYGGAAAYMQRFGVPDVLLPGAIVLELGGGVFIVLGLLTRPLAAVTAAYCIALAILFHVDFGRRGELVQFEKDVAIAGGFLVLAVCGAGRWSIDHWLAHRCQLPTNG